MGRFSGDAADTCFIDARAWSRSESRGGLNGPRCECQPEHLNANAIGTSSSAVETLETTFVNKRGRTAADFSIGIPKLLKRKSGRPGSNRRRPAWEASRRLNIKNIGAHRRACRSKQISNFYPIRLLMPGIWRVFLRPRFLRILVRAGNNSPYVLIIMMGRIT